MTSQDYKAYTLHNFRTIPRMARLTERQRREIETVGHVLPFKTNSLVVDHLIDWDKVPEDPLFVLDFPQRDMLLPRHFEATSELMERGADAATLKEAADQIRMQLNPAFGESRFFFEDELGQLYRENLQTLTADDFE